ncbi:unnamed protein product [Hydatigera taeniaeformis]|uniref:ANF_receptor domain-containing protein n=1 Tax=Hydatigena taeniaeformis TaxID=6205 RepID=A0A0R3X039_HYDTA|nr:unnamed protein product [Hydatigera taeniaeformis]
MKQEHQEALCGYRFYISDDTNTLKPFLKEDDRRIASIQKTCNSRICLTRETRVRKGQKRRAVLVHAHSRRELELCLRRIDDTFPNLYACSNLYDAVAAVRMIRLRKYQTTEDLSVGLLSTMVTYYQLSFNFDSRDMVKYDYWRKTCDAMLCKKLGCVLLIAMKDTPGAGFLRRHAIISGECRKNVITSYNVLRATFAELPEFEDEGSISTDSSLRRFNT